MMEYVPYVVLLGGYLQHVHNDPDAPYVTPLAVSTAAHHFGCWNGHTEEKWQTWYKIQQVHDHLKFKVLQYHC